MAVVAARSLRSPVFGRRSPLRRQRSRMAAFGVSLAVLVATFAVAGAFSVAVTTEASAQSFTYNPRPPKPTRPPANRTAFWERTLNGHSLTGEFGETPNESWA